MSVLNHQDLHHQLQDLQARLSSIRSALGDRTVTEPLPRAAFDVLVCRVDQALVSFMLDSVEQVVQMAALADIPEADTWVLGLLDLGGALLPVIDVHARLTGTPRRPALDDMILVCASERGRFGLVVQEVLEVARVRPAQFQGDGSPVARAAYVIGALTDERGTTTLLSVARLASLGSLGGSPTNNGQDG